MELSCGVSVLFVAFSRPVQRMPCIVPLGAVPLAAANLRRPPYATHVLKRKCIRRWRILHSSLAFCLCVGRCLHESARKTLLAPSEAK